MSYSISIIELIKKPIIRNDRPEEFLNKMTDEEISQYEREMTKMMLKDGVPQKYPDWNAEVLSRTIDRGIMYEIFKNKL